MIIRLVGLTFPSGQATVLPAHRDLLREGAEGRRRVSALANRRSKGTPTRTATTRQTSTLSRRRAEAIGAYLTGTLGVTASRVSAVGYGETQPIASNDTPQGRERNRRIDVIIEPQLDQ